MDVRPCAETRQVSSADSSPPAASTWGGRPIRLLLRQVIPFYPGRLDDPMTLIHTSSFSVMQRRCGDPPRLLQSGHDLAHCADGPSRAACAYLTSTGHLPRGLRTNRRTFYKAVTAPF